MREITANAFEEILGPFVGLGDDDHSPFRAVDPSDKLQIQAMLRTAVRPHFDNLPAERQFAVKLSLSHFLTITHDASAFERPLDCILASGLCTPNPRDFFFWLWEELFPGESSELAERERYKVSKRGVLLRDRKPILPNLNT